jgi:hypothetical protein
VPASFERISSIGDTSLLPQHNILLMKAKSIQREESFGLLPIQTDHCHRLLCDNHLKQALLLRE